MHRNESFEEEVRKGPDRIIESLDKGDYADAISEIRNVRSAARTANMPISHNFPELSDAAYRMGIRGELDAAEQMLDTAIDDPYGALNHRALGFDIYGKMDTALNLEMEGLVHGLDVQGRVAELRVRARKAVDCYIDISRKHYDAGRYGDALSAFSYASNFAREIGVVMPDSALQLGRKLQAAGSKR